MRRPLVIAAGFAIFFILLLFSMTYTVSFHEVGIQSRFGETSEDSIVRTPGLHFRLPFFADSVAILDTRLRIHQAPLEMLQTADGQQIVVRAFLLWRVERDGTSPLDFYRAYGSTDAAKSAIDSQFRDAITVMSAFTFDELTGENNQLAQAESSILSKLETLNESGVVPVSVGINRLLLPPKTTTAVLNRMQARRDTLAEQRRAKGTADAEAIRAEAKAKHDKIMAFASQRAAEIRLQGEEQAAVYLKDMGEEEELAIFLAWLDAVETALSKNTTLVLESDVAPWHLLNVKQDQSKNIPLPPNKGDTSTND
jgi:membrane protease subunit HflC